MQWLEETFLPYLDDWEKSVNARQGYSRAEKNRMMLSSETLLGLRMTSMSRMHTIDISIIIYSYFFIAKSFIELLQYLFSLPDVKDNHLAFLSNHLCQDPLESFFGQQRQRGRTGDNPNVQEFLNNTAALRVVNGFCRGPTTGNCRLRELQSLGAENTPLCRRRRHKK